MRLALIKKQSALLLFKILWIIKNCEYLNICFKKLFWELYLYIEHRNRSMTVQGVTLCSNIGSRIAVYYKSDDGFQVFVSKDCPS